MLAKDWAPLGEWLLAAAVAVGCLLALVALRRTLRAHHQRLAATEQTEVMEMPLGVLSRTSLPFLLAVSAYLGARFLELPARSQGVLDACISIVAFWQCGLWLSAAFMAWFARKRLRTLQHDRAKVGSITIIAVVVRGLIWVLVVLLALDNLGINITALVAGLGIGGVAVALALQNILGDLFASLAIALDEPFVVGDFVVVGDVLGTVENIGIKSTRLRSISGEQVVIANADLIASRLRNFGRMRERRDQLVLNLAYETPPDELDAVPAIVRGIVEAQGGQRVRFDRCHFANLGSHSLDFECVYFVLSADYVDYMDVRQAINLALVREFARRGIEFAYPTQKLFLARSGAAPRLAPAPGLEN